MVMRLLMMEAAIIVPVGLIVGALYSVVRMKKQSTMIPAQRLMMAAASIKCSTPVSLGAVENTY
jgi:hypothetical protein